MAFGPVLWSAVLIILVWWGPGWLIGEALGIRRIFLPAAAPAMGLGLLSVIGAWGDYVHLPWNPLSVGIAVLLASALAFGIRLSVRRRGRRLPGPVRAGGTRVWWLYGSAAVVLAGVVGGYTWLHGTAALQSINQDWDIPWHANMLRLIADSQQWSPHIAGNFAYYDTTIATAPIRSYPIAFHAILALVWPASGLTIPGFINLFTMVLVAIQLPLSTMALTAVLVKKPLAVAAAGAASTWLTVYPYDLLWRGPLIPFFAGTLMVGPFVLLATHYAQNRRWHGVLAVGLAAVSVIAVHPSLAFVAAPVMLCWLASRFVHFRRRALGMTLFLLAAGGLGAILAVPIIREMLQEASRVARMTWPPDTTPQGAIRNAIFLSHADSQPVYAATVLIAIAVVGLLLRRRGRWYFLPVIGFGVLSIFTMGTNAKGVIRLAAAPFYDDQWRIVAVYILLLIPLIGAGVYFLAFGAYRLWRVAASRRAGAAEPGRRHAGNILAGNRALLPTTALGLVILLVAGSVSSANIKTSYARLAWTNKVTGSTLNSGEINLMTHISRWVPENATVLNDACDGSVWMYALGGRMPMIRHFEVIPTQRQQLLLTSLPKLPTDPAVRAAAAELGIDWVFVGEGRIRAGDKPKPGLVNLGHLPFLQLVAREGNASLYKIDWAKLPGGAAQVAADAHDRVSEPGVPGIWKMTDPSTVLAHGGIC